MILPEVTKHFGNFTSINNCATLADFVNLGPRLHGILLAESINHSVNQACSQSINQSINQSSHLRINTLVIN